MLATDLSVKKLVDTSKGTIHNAIFSHPDIYEQELEQIFARMWLLVGHESQIPRRGDFVRGRMGEEQVIVTRGTDNQVHVLLNSCAHRGMALPRRSSAPSTGGPTTTRGGRFPYPRAVRTSTRPTCAEKIGGSCRRGWKRSRAPSGPPGMSPRPA